MNPNVKIMHAEKQVAMQSAEQNGSEQHSLPIRFIDGMNYADSMKANIW